MQAPDLSNNAGKITKGTDAEADLEAGTFNGTTGSLDESAESPPEVGLRDPTAGDSESEIAKGSKVRRTTIYYRVRRDE